jgi:hypothetical protein
VLALCTALVLPALLAAQQGTVPLTSGRVTVAAFPADLPLARTLLAAAVARDTFPGLPRPRDRVVIVIAPDERRFREWIGPYAPEWGAAVAFLDDRRIVMQGRSAGSDAGDPLRVLRHELAHLALAEALGDLPPRWFDEGYASYSAGEWDRDAVLATNVALVLGGMPGLASLDSAFYAGAARADAAYALAFRAVAELAALSPGNDLTLLFRYWKETGSLDQALRRGYGITLAGFEERWQQRTRRRYGMLAVATNLSLAVAALFVVVGPLWVMRRRRDRRRLAAMIRRESEIERRERNSAIEALLSSLPGGDEHKSRDEPP